MVVSRLQLRFAEEINGSRHAVYEGKYIRLNDLMLFACGVHRPEIRAKVVLHHQTLILAQLRLMHASFTVETRNAMPAAQIPLACEADKKNSVTSNNTRNNTEKQKSYQHCFDKVKNSN